MTHLHLDWKDGKIRMYMGTTAGETRRDAALGLALAHMQLGDTTKNLSVAQLIANAKKIETFLEGPTGSADSGPES